MGGEEAMTETTSSDSQTATTDNSSQQRDTGDENTNCFCKYSRKAFSCVASYWKVLLAIAILYSFGLICSSLLQEEVQIAVTFFGETGAPGILLYLLCYTILIPMGVPATLLSIATAFLFDELYQIYLLNVAADNISRAFGFAIGKYVLYGWVKRNAFPEDKPITKALTKMMKSHPVKYTALWFLAYLPTWSQTYGSPVLGCPFWAFMVGSFLPVAGNAIIWSFVGQVTRNTIEGVQNGEGVEAVELGATIGGVVLLLLIMAFIARKVRRELKVLEAEEAAKEQEPILEDAANVAGSVHRETSLT